jgi:hypothetical protein
MTEDREHPAPASGDRGVFGNLPSERPGVRSPRRGEGKSKQAKAGGAKRTKAASAAAKPAPKAPPPPPPSAREEPPPEPAPQAAESGRGSVEEVAWAGITVAAEAATLGVRLVSRALEAVRERR